MLPLIAPSILSADLARLGEECEAVIDAGADMIHFDVMDNHYVPNLTFGPMICGALRKFGIEAPIDVHLMVEPVDALIEMFADEGASYITFHPEASRHIDRSLKLIEQKGCKKGLVLNPATPIGLIEPVIDQLDMLLLMSVNPGFGGQKFIPQTLDKLRQARELVSAKGLETRIEIDGGVTTSNIKEITEAGADTFVAGSAIFGSSDYESTISQMKQQIEQANLTMGGKS